MSTKKWFLSYEIVREQRPTTRLHTFLEGLDAEDALECWLAERCDKLELERQNFTILQFNLV